MTLDLGDRQYGHGDNETREAAVAIDAGQWVGLNSNGNLELADSANSISLLGVASDSADAGESVTVWYRGIVKAEVDSSVAVDDELGAPDSGATSGATTPGVAGAGTKGPRVLNSPSDSDGDGNPEAFCLLR